ncbi:MAG: prenyltransferase/squalene oxidase repeat-containing protein [Phycisphaerales bacterium]|jgi:squalene-hopene/tetraprenyl-beta-curcumene cyclase
MSTVLLNAWTMALVLLTPPTDVDRALRDAPTVPLDSRVDASRMTRLAPPGVPDRLTPPPPIMRRIAENSGDVPIAPATFDAARASIRRGLAYLRGSQSASGGWMEGTPAQGSEAPKISKAASSAVTGLVIRAFAQAGLLEGNDPAVARGVAWLVKACWSADGFEPDASGGLATYVASCTALGLASLDSVTHAERLREVIAWLRRAQWDQGEGLGPEQDWFGGVGYGSRGRPDLSNTQMMLEALHESGAKAEDPAVQRALAFVARCQNVRSEGAAPWANTGSADGGFVYTVANGGESFASEAAGEGRFGEKMPEGTRALRSYGSMTYAGYKSMLFAGLRRDDPRVLAALDWARAHWSMQENPGLGKQGLFYYRLALARALAASGRDIMQDTGGTPHEWRKELVEALVAAQRPDGSWINDQDRWMEGEPDLVTAYALLALEEAIKPSRQSQ